jgi:hypothetical protein
VTLSLTACSSGSGGRGPVDRRGDPAGQRPGQRRRLLPRHREVIAALNSKGLPCEEPMEGTYPGVSDAQSCILDGAEDVVVLGFATPAERSEYVTTKEELAHAVLGQDWAVQTVLPQTAEKVAGVLGGEVVLGATS